MWSGIVTRAKAGSRACPWLEQGATAASLGASIPTFERVKELQICRIGAVRPLRQPRSLSSGRAKRGPVGSFLRMRSFFNAIKDFLILRACESFASMGFGPQHLVPQSSRRPLYVVKFLPKTKRFTGSEEAARRPSRRTHNRGCSRHFDFLTGSKAGIQRGQHRARGPGPPLSRGRRERESGDHLSNS